MNYRKLRHKNKIKVQSVIGLIMINHMIKINNNNNKLNLNI